jgi:hypothetical protein
MSLAANAAIADAMVITKATAYDAEGTEDGNPELAAAHFVDHINYARVALAMHEYDVANAHISEAQDALALLRQANLESHKSVQVESGRVVYDYDTDQKNHYFPVSSEPVEVREMGKGPFWAKANTLAVTDAEIAYVTLDLNGSNAEKGLAKAKKALEQEYYTDADAALSKLIQQVVKVDAKDHMPQQVASDNIALARDFLSLNNYAGARFALKHADAALDTLERGLEEGDRKDRAEAMRKEVQTLRDEVAAGDPGLLTRADSSLKQWWRELKSWTD